MNDAKIELINLMNEYGSYLKQTAFHVLHDLQLAEDMTQETFISYYKTKQFSAKSSVKTYLYKILMNHIRMYLRKNKLKLVYQENYENAETISFESNSVNQMDLSYAISNLNQKYQEVLILYYYNDLSVEEISRILECSKSTIKMRLKRGREKLKLKMGGYSCIS